MRSIRLMICLAVCLLLVGSVALPTTAEAGDDPFVRSMKQLSRDTEDLLFFLLRDDTENIQHAAIDLRHSLGETLRAGTDTDLDITGVQMLTDMLDDADELIEQVADDDMDDATDLYFDILENCFACHRAD